MEGIVSNFPDAIHSVDIDGKIVRVNKKAIQLYGFTREELLSKNIFDLYVNAEKAKLDFARLRQEGKMEVDSRLKTKQGKLIDIRITSFALYNKSRKFVRTFSIVREITEQKKLQRKIFQADRFSAMGKFSAGLVHDIRSPLTIIKGFNDCVQESETCQQDKQLMATIELVTRAVAKIEYFTTQLLHSPEAGACEDLREIDLVGVVKTSLEMLSTKIRDNEVSIDNALPDSCRLQGRQHQLEQVFSNIISNACDAVKGMDERLVTMRMIVEDEQVTVAISDTGTGIVPEVQDKIFDSFFTTKDREQGVGLGLSIADEIVASHNGRIEIKKNNPQGAVFLVILPKIVSV